MSFLHDLKIAVRSLSRVPALWFTVALTLALGIGANAAIFSVVRGVLLKPLANRDEDRLLYLRQSAPGINEPNSRFSVPEIQDMGTGLRSIKELGTFSEIDFTIVGLGTPREIQAQTLGTSRVEIHTAQPMPEEVPNFQEAEKFVMSDDRKLLNVYSARPARTPPSHSM